MSVIEDLRSFLIAEEQVEDWDVFLDKFQDLPDEAVCIYLYDSFLPLVNSIPSGSARIQIVTRAKTYRAARAQAEKMFKFLRDQDTRVMFTTTRWANITTIKPPMKLKEDDKGRPYYFFNLAIITNL